MRYIVGLLYFFICDTALGARNCAQLDSLFPWWQEGWATTLYSGPLTSQTSSKIIKDADLGNSGIIALAISKKLGSVGDKKLDFELETQAVQHFGEQTHFELNPIALVLRWRSFPWDKTLPTTLAIGDGISIAMRNPKLEVKRRKEDTARTLNYVMVEATFSPPSFSKWAFVLRYHHRSGMFGVFHGVHDASTVFAAGIKYWF